MKIVVLAGGLSSERMVSLSTGAMVSRALREKGYDVAFVDMYLGIEQSDVTKLFEMTIPEEYFVIQKEAPNLEEVKEQRKENPNSLFGPGVLDLCQKADMVFLALHGVCGEDGRVQACFDLFGIPYTGSGHLGSAIAMDKDYTKRMLQTANILMPAWKVIKYTEMDIQKVSQEITLPCVVKTLKSGSSLGVYIIHDKDKLSLALKECLKYDDTVMVEQYIKGREFTCGVLNGNSLPTVEIEPQIEFYDYESKYQVGATLEICPGRISKEQEEFIQKTALTVHKELGLSVYSRSDFILDEENNVYFLEVNTLPGMTPTSLLPQEAKAVGIDYGSLCEQIILASKKEREQ